MLDKEEHQLIIDASVLYYMKGKTQSQIAKEIYISRPKVSRLLKKHVNCRLSISASIIGIMNSSNCRKKSDISSIFQMLSSQKP